MKRQHKAQLILFLTGIILIILTYFYYPNLDKDMNLKNKIVKEKSLEEFKKDEESTLFDNVKYKGLYDYDKTFTIEAEKAYILNKEVDVVYMTNMHVILYLNDGRIVNITSTKGRYNKSTYDCFFENNVKATDGETEIFADNLDLLAEENAVKVYNNVNLNYVTGSLRADKIDYDFETKYFKVSMFDDQAIKMKVVK
tara:strand:+ start:64 stop:654 length:591 start_codon:yes stop_codon:yes gene_type:complete